ncbi:MAG: SpoIID/LytB domain-containing protein [Tepidanaerobacteraceae bacterium]|nr:SpoIID/LytB domain-containing protein [Tepidanaerobacteraceae bacterium]
MKKIALILFLLCCFIVYSDPVYGYEDIIFESPIRVGLFYNETAPEEFDLNCESGFIVGFKNGKNYERIVEIDDKHIEVSKVSNGSFLPAKENLKSIQEAERILENLSLKKENGFIFYNGNWSVWIKDKAAYSDNTGDFIKINTQTFQLILPLNSEVPIYFFHRDEKDIISINGHRYRGLIEVLPSQDKKINVVNELEIEDYLYGVLPLEMPPNWPFEALKAQAVASRTYAIYNLSKWEKYGFDVSANTADQAYGGYDAEQIMSNKAVEQTKGRYITYEGRPIMALFHADSGGITEDGKNVFGSDLPYLKSVEDSFDSNSPYAEWGACFSPNDISEKISKTDASVGEVENISIIEKTSTGRVKKILISGTKGNKVFSGSEIRNILQLKSLLFDIQSKNANIYAISIGDAIHKVSFENRMAVSATSLSSISSKNAFVMCLSGIEEISSAGGDGFNFYGRGCGHGVGMSQWGAKYMAEEGYNYMQILQHYYKNVEIK